MSTGGLTQESFLRLFVRYEDDLRSYARARARARSSRSEEAESWTKRNGASTQPRYLDCYAIGSGYLASETWVGLTGFSLLQSDSLIRTVTGMDCPPRMTTSWFIVFPLRVFSKYSYSSRMSKLKRPLASVFPNAFT